MAKIEDDIFNSDEMISPVEASAPTEEPAPAKVERAEGPAVVPVEEMTPKKQPPYPAIAIAIGVPVVFLALAFLNFINFSTALYIIGLAFIPLAIWMGRKTSTVYVVFLGCVLAALLTIVYFLWIPLAKYHFDVKAQEAKQRVGMTQPVDRNVREAKQLV